MTTVLPQVREGRLRALGVASLKRTPLAPDIPAIAETLPGFEATSWVGVVGPAGVPAPILNKLAAAFHAAMADPEVVTRLKALGATPETDTPAEFQQFILADRTKWIKLAKDAHIVQEK